MMARPCQKALSVLAILLLAFGALAAAADDCGALMPDPHCPFCQLANLPMAAPAQTPQPARPEMAERYSVLLISAEERECTFDFGSTRAPPINSLVVPTA